MAFIERLFGGGRSKTTYPAAVSGLQLQSSNYGSPIQIVYGTTRIAPNLIWYGDFQSHASSPPPQHHGKGGVTGGGGGKGGGGGTTSYTYTTAVILGLSEGPIQGVGTVFVNKDTSTIAKLGMTLFTGTYAQTAWSYLSTNHPSQALNYRGVAYLAASNYQLGTSPQLPNHNFEVQGIYSTSLSGIGIVDADPSLVINDVLTNAHYGAAFPSGRVGSLTNYQNYAIATGLWISPAYNLQAQASSILDEIATATNSAFVWSSGTLNLVPYGDTSITANGHTYTAPSAPIYALADDDFQANPVHTASASANNNTDPVLLMRKRPADQINSVKLECLDRSHSYNPAIIEAKDQAMIDVFGLRQAPSKQTHLFCDLNAARMSAQLQLQRQAIRNVYSFTLDQRYILLDPMDIVSITDSGLGLSNQWVRILEITENSDGSLSFLAEEYLQGTGASPLYNFQSSDGSTTSSLCDPGPTFAVVTDVPYCLDNNVPAIWMAAGGPGGSFNSQKGTFTVWYDPIGFRSSTQGVGTTWTDTIFKAQNEWLGTNGTAGAIGGTFGVEAALIRSSGLGTTFTFFVAAHIQVQINANPGAIGADSAFLWIPTIAQVSAGGFAGGPMAIGVMWDTTGPTWIGKIFVNGVDVTDYSLQASKSEYVNNTTSAITTGTTMPYPMDSFSIFNAPTFPGSGPSLIQDYYWIGSGGNPSPGVTVGGGRFATPLLTTMAISQLWVTGGVAVDFTTDWNKFFDGSNAPIDLGSDGSKPTGLPPLIYLPYDTSSLGTNVGILGNFNITSGSVAIVNATGIPASGSYQAVGLQLHGEFDPSTIPSPQSGLGANSPIPIERPVLTACETWGSCNVFISTDLGNSYQQVGVIAAPSPCGVLTTLLPLSNDPDTTDTLSVDLGYSQGQLDTVSQSDADSLISLCVLTHGHFEDYEFISYETATLTDSFRYNLTYLRRNQYYHTPSPDAFGLTNWFARLDLNVFKFHYARNLIGTTIYYKLQPVNGVGAGSPDLSTIAHRIYTLQGPDSLNPPSFLEASEAAGTVTLNWNQGTGCAIVGYDAGLDAPFTYTPSTGDHGLGTFWIDPIDPGAKKVGHIFSDTGTNTITVGTELDIYYNQDALGTTQTGKYVISHKIITYQSGVTYILWTTSTLQNLSGGAVAVGFEWDGTGTTWSGKILINGTDVTDTAFQAANSSHGGTPGLAMGVAMDGTQAIFDALGTWIGAIDPNPAPDPGITYDNSAFGLSQLWIAPGETLDLTIAGNWAKFFDASNHPIDLGRQGETPLSAVPLYFYPCDPTDPGHSSGQYGILDFSKGGFAQDTNAAFTKPAMIVGNQSALGNTSGNFGFGYLVRNTTALTTSVSGLAPGSYTFQVRSVDTLNFTSPWTTINFTVT